MFPRNNIPVNNGSPTGAPLGGGTYMGGLGVHFPRPQQPVFPAGPFSLPTYAAPFYMANFSDSSPVRRPPMVYHTSNSSSSAVADLYGDGAPMAHNSTSNISVGTSISKCHLSRKEDNLCWSPTGMGDPNDSPHSFDFGGMNSVYLEQYTAEKNGTLYGQSFYHTNRSPSVRATSPAGSRCSLSMLSNGEDYRITAVQEDQDASDATNAPKSQPAVEEVDSSETGNSCSSGSRPVLSEAALQQSSENSGSTKPQSSSLRSAGYSYGSLMEASHNISPLTPPSIPRLEDSARPERSTFSVSPPATDVRRSQSYHRRQYLRKSISTLPTSTARDALHREDSIHLVDPRQTQSCPSSPVASSLPLPVHRNGLFKMKRFQKGENSKMNKEDNFSELVRFSSF